LLSTLLAGLAEMLPVGPRLFCSLSAPVAGYALAYTVRQFVAFYEYRRFSQQVDGLIAQMHTEAHNPDTTAGRRLDIEDQIFELLILKQKAMLKPKTLP
jgi:hypothetical protein